MKTIDQDISTGKLKQIYYLFGEEPYLVQFYKNKLQKTLTGGDSMNTAFFDETAKDAGPVIEYADTFPFFADKRLILLNGVKFPKDQEDRLATYFDNMAETAFFVIIGKEALDKRTKFYKAIEKNGHIAEFKRQDERTLRIWCGRKFREAGLTISESDISYFLHTAGNDMNSLSCELEKIIAYCLDKQTITKEDISEVTVVDIKEKIFDLVDAVASGDRDAAMREYDKLHTLMVAPAVMIALLGRQFTILANIKALRNRGMQSREIANNLRMYEFVVEKAIRQGNRFSDKKIRKMMDLCADAEYQFKSGQYSDVMAIELLIAKLTRQ